MLTFGLAHAWQDMNPCYRLKIGTFSITLKFLASLEKWKALAALSLYLLMAAGG